MDARIVAPWEAAIRLDYDAWERWLVANDDPDECHFDDMDTFAKIHLYSLFHKALSVSVACDTRGE